MYHIKYNHNDLVEAIIEMALFDIRVYYKKPRKEDSEFARNYRSAVRFLRDELSYISDVDGQYLLDQAERMAKEKKRGSN